jgi:hypothetical protein
MFIGVNRAETFFEFGINVFRFDSRLDQLCEGGASWNTALFFRFSSKLEDDVYLIDDKELRPFRHYFY